MKRSSLIIALVAFSLAAFVVKSTATPITFIFTGQGSGSIGGTAFGVSDFTITGYGDTDNTQYFGWGSYLDHDSASIDIAGVGALNFVTATRTFFNDSLDIAGFSRAGFGGTDLYNGPSSALLDGWDMLSSIGPIGGSLQLMQWLLSPVVTDAGQLIFNSSSTRGTFQAIVGSSVPENSTTVLLIGCALVGLGAMRRKFAGA